MPVGDITNLHYNSVVAKPLVYTTLNKLLFLLTLPSYNDHAKVNLKVIDQFTFNESSLRPSQNNILSLYIIEALVSHRVPFLVCWLVFFIDCFFPTPPKRQTSAS